ncbi:hypothetical protein RISK_001547 [Rhodopirellula islandica]|uniref:Uncharacterized protein n=1 Tax=Rhodopirellula islandica TaxID=595434 RepID=A0A0J1BIE0_RHOIS|nr:hypothetical protein RISK_001547 [Rhodopirellula islandica]
MWVDSTRIARHDESGTKLPWSRTIQGKTPSKDWSLAELARLSV